MKLVIDLAGFDSPNSVCVTVTAIGDRAALDILYEREPCEGEIAAINEVIAEVLRVTHGECVLVSNERIDDPQERQAAMRRFLGGGQG